MSKYSLKRQITHISLEKENGGTEEFELREMSAAKRDAYLDRLSRRVKIGAKGENMGVSNFEGLQADLIASCLFGENGRAVAIQEIQEWPASVVAGIFKQAQELNSLGQEIAEAGAKNE